MGAWGSPVSGVRNNNNNDDEINDNNNDNSSSSSSNSNKLMFNSSGRTNNVCLFVRCLGIVVCFIVWFISCLFVRLVSVGVCLVVVCLSGGRKNAAGESREGCRGLGRGLLFQDADRPISPKTTWSEKIEHSRNISDPPPLVSGERKPCWQKPCWQIYAHGLHGHVGASARVAPLGKDSYFLKGTFLVAVDSVFCKSTFVISGV